MVEFKIRKAAKKDAEIVLGFIEKIADYENMSNQVVNSAELVKEVVFDNKSAEVLLAFENDVPVGFALYYMTYSTFVGRQGIHLEDLFVNENKRSLGYGKALIQEIIRIAVENNYGRVEWCCLDWNTPSQKFYESLGAKHLSEWWDYRLEGDELVNALNK